LPLQQKNKSADVVTLIELYVCMIIRSFERFLCDTLQ